MTQGDMTRTDETGGECADMDGVSFTYPFLRGIDPARPPASITIPEKDLCAMGHMERQYWEIKSRLYNVVLFFKKGKFYELYDYDAVIAHREFGLKMVIDTSNRGKMRLAGVPEQSYKEWARLFVFRGYKVGRVEQIREGGAGDGEGSGGATLSAPLPKAKVVPRELVEVLTPGTLKDPAMLSDHNEVFILALAPCQCGLLDACGAATVVVDAVAVDLSRHVAYWCPCVDAAAARRLREAAQDVSPDGCPPTTMAALFGSGADTCERLACEAALQSLSALLQQLQPREIVVAKVGGRVDVADDKSCMRLAQWVEAEGYQAEVLPRPTTVSAGLCAQATPAHRALQYYFTKLRLTADLPLLAEATLYTAHLPTVATAAAQPVRGATTAIGSLLAWERRFDRGLVLDAATVSNLEVVATLQGGAEQLTLNAQLNRCITNGGKRLFRSWLLRPSAESRVIAARQAVVRFVLEGRHQALLEGTVAGGSSQTPSDMKHGTALLTPTQNGNELQDSSSSGGTCESSASEGAVSSRKRPRCTADEGACLCLAGYDFATVDLERNLSRLAELKTATQTQYIAYIDPLVEYKRNLQLILHTLQCFSDLIDWAHAVRCYLQRQQCGTATQGTPCQLPPLLHELLEQIELASTSMTAIDRLFDRRAARAQELLLPAPGACPEYDRATSELAAVTQQLEAGRARAQATAFAGAEVSFAEAGKDTFLLEVAAAAAPHMTPAGMVERARSARSVKYAVRALEGLAEAHKAATAAKTTALLNVLSSVAARVGDYFASLYNALAALSYLDCLFSLARIACPASPLSRYCCMPELAAAAGSRCGQDRLSVQDSTEEEGGALLQATDLVHPLLATGTRTVAVVPNDIALDDRQGRMLLLTGPNMAGKSTLMRTVAVNAMLAQLGGPVLARSMLLRPLDRIFTRIGARDASHKGQSTLYVELSETAEIVRAATSRSLCLIDELGRGTSTHDGLAIAHATLHVLKAHQPRPPLTIFSTHYHALAFEQARGVAGTSERRASPVQLGYMDFVLGQDTETARHAVGDNRHADTAADGLPSITFLYRLVRGVCARSYGVEVALMAGLPEPLVRLAKAKSDDLARWSALHEDAQLLRRFCNSV